MNDLTKNVENAHARPLMQASWRSLNRIFVQKVKIATQFVKEKYQKIVVLLHSDYK